MITEYIPQLLGVVGALVIVTNIVTEVLKKFTEKHFSTNWLALSVSMILTLSAYFGFSAYKAFPVTWYSVAAAVVVGFMVCYAAMFGFDKLKQALEGK